MTELSLSDSKIKSKAFMGQMISIINGGALSLMISIGHKTGLFDIMDGSPPATSDEISKSAKLDERYVREWLSALSCGGILEHDSTAETFFLPPEHAGLLTRRSGPLNLAIPAKSIATANGIHQSLRYADGAMGAATAIAILNDTHDVWRYDLMWFLLAVMQIAVIPLMLFAYPKSNIKK